MATPIATAAVQIVPSFKGLHQSTAKAIGGVEAEFKKSGGQSGSIFSKALKGVAGAGVVAAGGAIATGFGMAVAKGFSRLNAIDQAEKKLQGLGHSTQAVEGIMKNALASVKGTAFGLDEAANVSASLVASGIKPGQELEKTLKTVADSATIAGIGMEDMGAIFGKVAATGKLQGDELNQLSERGIPALQLLSKHLGVTTDQVRKMVSKGQVDFKTFSEAMNSGVGGAAQKSGETFMGAWKNVQAALGRIGATLLEPIFNALKDSFNVLTPALDEMQKAMEPFAAAFAELVAGVMPIAIATFKGLVAVLVSLVTWLSKNMWLVKTLAGLVAFAAAAYAGWVIGAKLLVAVQTIQMLIGYKMLTLTKLQALATGLWAKAQAGLNAMLSANPIGAVIVAIIALIAIFVVAYKKVGWFRNAVNAAWAGIKFAVGAVVTWFQTFVWPALQRVWAWIAQGAVWLWRNVMVPAWNGIKATVFAVVGWFQTTMLPFIQATFKAVGAVFNWLWAWVVRPIFGFIKAYIQVWWASVKVVFNALVWFFRNVLGPVFKWLWSVISAVLSLAKAMFIQWVNHAKATFSVLVNFVKTVLGPVFQWLWTWIIRPVFNFIKAYIQVWWLGVRLVFQAVVNFVKRALGPAFLWLWRNVIVPAWNGIKAVISGVWNFIRDRVFNPLAHAVRHTLPAAFRAGRDAIGQAWEGLKNIAKKPVEFVVNTVINRGLVDNFNKIAGVFGSKKIPQVSLPKGFATGGRIPGWSPTATADNVPIWATAGEFMVRRKSADRLRRNHPGALEHINRHGTLPIMGYKSGGDIVALGHALQKLGVRVSEHPAFGGVHPVHAKNSWHYRNGALDLNYGPGGTNAVETAFFDQLAPILHNLGWGVIWRYTGHYGHAHVDLGNRSLGSFNRHAPAGAIAGGLQKALEGIKGAGQAIGNAFVDLNPFTKLKNLIKNGLAKIGDSPFVSLVASAGNKLVTSALDWMRSRVPVGGDQGAPPDSVAPSGKGIERWRPLVRQALQFTGIGGGQADEDRWLRQIKTESGGNPRLVQSSALRDINVRRGDPARGLVQVPGVTWTDFGGGMGPFFPNVYDPLKNLIVGMRAASRQHRRKSYHGMSGWRSVVGWGHGYADGGTITKYDTGGWLPPGLTTTINQTGKPEAVFTQDQFQHIKAAALHGSPMSITINGVHVDNAEEVARAVRFELIRQGRGGRYATA
ncbi:tape measure protein [Brevibacterium sp. UMB1308A]|uniref:tape measure protein n=1 Tax=Brevibacterium sp. UMB1308A TaxID=3050608 RepID=UPI00254BE948|nr:tape measure protein [Brevibacterium sp. UMB1308A]MDK8345426.1 tape measure protein [Brevibacterium sp. UMB1308B]MDK8712727.1 tape measure protein [Brevibacterium sp. UMB1308A]